MRGKNKRSMELFVDVLGYSQEQILDLQPGSGEASSGNHVSGVMLTSL